MVKLIGHRGAAAEAPENSLRSYRRAIELGADAIELDLQLTKDGVPVVYHDDNLWRTFGIDENIYELTFDALKDLSPAMFFSLDELLTVDRKRTALMLDIKTETDPAPILERFDPLPDDVYFFAFSDSLMKTLRARLPKENLIGMQGRDDDLGILSVRFDRITQELTKQKKIWAWTVDHPKRAQELVALGVDGLITNDLVGIGAAVSTK